MKKIVCFVLTLVMVLSSLCIYISATETITNDEFLLSLGVPQNVINQLTEGQKCNLRETIPVDAIYCSYETSTMNLSESIGYSITRLGTIPADELTMSAMGFEVTVNGELQYCVSVSFILDFSSFVNLDNDAFVISLYSGWEYSGFGNQNLRVYDNDTAYDDYLPINTTSYGSEYRLSDNSISLDGDYEGYTNCYLRKVDSNATHAINLRYVQDALSSDNSQYTVNLGVGGSTLSGDTTNLNTRAGNYSY